jgi:hypothetical protein
VGQSDFVKGTASAPALSVVERVPPGYPVKGAKKVAEKLGFA